MARYKDLYTPARDYGQVYQGGLRQRTESQERAGKNMVDFAGDIYNLVDKQRQKKMQEREMQSLETERASVQSYRKSRQLADEEQKRFNRYVGKLNSIVKLHDGENRRLDTLMYPKFQGSDNTGKAYDERFESYQDRMNLARDQNNFQQMRYILNEYKDLFPTLQGKEAANILDAELGVPDNQLQTFAPMTKSQWMIMHRAEGSGENQYQDALDAVLSDPTYGYPELVNNAKKDRQDAKGVTKQALKSLEKISLGDTEPEPVEYTGADNKLESGSDEGKELAQIVEGTEKGEKGEVPPPPDGGLVFPDPPDVEEEPGFTANNLETIEILKQDNPWLNNIGDGKTAAAIDLILDGIKMSLGEGASSAEMADTFKKYPKMVQALRSNMAQVAVAEFKDKKGPIYKELDKTEEGRQLISDLDLLVKRDTAFTKLAEKRGKNWDFLVDWFKEQDTSKKGFEGKFPWDELLQWK